MPGRTCSYIPVIPAPPSNRLRVGDPYRPSLQASFDGRVRCHYGITAKCATLGGARLDQQARATEGAGKGELCGPGPRLALAREVCASAPVRGARLAGARARDALAAIRSKAAPPRVPGERSETRDPGATRTPA